MRFRQSANPVGMLDQPSPHQASLTTQWYASRLSLFLERMLLSVESCMSSANQNRRTAVPIILLTLVLPLTLLIAPSLCEENKKEPATPSKGAIPDCCVLVEGENGVSC